MFEQEIKQARWKLGLTQKQLSQILDCTEHTVQNWESGRVAPKFTVVLAVRWLLQNPEYVKAALEKRKHEAWSQQKNLPSLAAVQAAAGGQPQPERG